MLEFVHFEENSQLETIEDFAFSSSSIEKIVLPPSLNRINQGCFSYCQIKEIIFAENSELDFVDRIVFYNSNLESISIPSSVSNFELRWCLEASKISKIKVFPNKNIQNILYFDDKFILGKSDKNSDVFDILLFARRDLKEAVIPSFIKTISNCAFEECYQLQSVTFLNDSSLISINQRAFVNSSIKSIVIPDSVMTIGPLSFSKCKNLRSVVLSDNSQLRIIEDDVFKNSSLESLYIPHHVKTISESLLMNCMKIIEIDENKELMPVNVNNFKKYSVEIIMVATELKDLFYVNEKYK